MGFRNRFQRLLATVALTLSALTATQHGIAAGLMAPVDSNLPPLQIREQHVTTPMIRILRPTTVFRFPKKAPWPNSPYGSTTNQ